MRTSTNSDESNIKPKQSKVNQFLPFYSLAFIFLGICIALDYRIPYLTFIIPNVPKGRNHGFIYVPYNYETVDYHQYIFADEISS